MTTLDILNFAHGRARPFEARIGELKLVVDEAAVRNIQLLHRHPSRTYTALIDAQRGCLPAVVQNEGTTGTWARTARIELPAPAGEQRRALLAAPDFQADLDWDFCMLASFLTGRRVCRTYEKERYRPDVLGDPLVREDRTIGVLASIWDARVSIANSGVLPALWNYIWSNDTVEMNIKAVLLSSALNVLYDAAWRQSGKPLLDRPTREALLKEIEELIAQRLSDPLVLAETLASFRNSFGGISAPAKIRHYLIHLGLATDDGASEDVLKRIKLFNAARNAFVHQGKAPRFSGISDERSGEICAALVAGVLPALVRVGLSRYLGLDHDADLQEDMDDVRVYFRDGTFRGQRIHDETYREFVERAEREWMWLGTLPT